MYMYMFPNSSIYVYVSRQYILSTCIWFQEGEVSEESEDKEGDDNDDDDGLSVSTTSFTYCRNPKFWDS